MVKVHFRVSGVARNGPNFLKADEKKILVKIWIIVEQSAWEKVL